MEQQMNFNLVDDPFAVPYRTQMALITLINADSFF